MPRIKVVILFQVVNISITLITRRSKIFHIVGSTTYVDIIVLSKSARYQFIPPVNIGKHIVVSSIVAFCIGSAPCINGRLWYQLVPTGIVGHCHVIGLHGSNVISKLHACGR